MSEMPKGGDSTEQDTARLLVTSRTDVPTFESERFKKSMEDASKLVNANKVKEDQVRAEAPDILAREFGVLAPELKGSESQKITQKGGVDAGKVDGTEPSVKPLDINKVLDRAQNAPAQQPQISVDPSVKRDIAEAQAQMKDKLGIDPANAGVNVEKFFSGIGKGIQSLIKAFFDFLKKIDGTNPSAETKKDFARLFDKKEIFDSSEPFLRKYGAKLADGKGNYEIQFASDAKITGKKVGKTEVGNSQNTAQVESITVKDGKILVGKDAIITGVTEKGEGNIALSIKNKDGSVETYEISGAKKVEQPKDKIA